MTPAPEVEAYLATLAPERRGRLEAIRAIVLDEASLVDEVISHRMPTYRLAGRMVVSIASFARHDSVFPASGEVRDRLGTEVEPFVRGRGTFQFQLRDPLPLGLIRRIIRTRIEEVTGVARS